MGRHTTLLYGIVSGALAATIMAIVPIDTAMAQGSVFQATLAEPNQKTPEVSTEEVYRVLADGSAILVDARKRSEYMAGHIAGAKSAMLEPGTPPEALLDAVLRLVSGDKSKPLVLYCNGAHCMASREVGEKLIAAGFTNVTSLVCRCGAH